MHLRTLIAVLAMTLFAGCGEERAAPAQAGTASPEASAPVARAEVMADPSPAEEEESPAPAPAPSSPQIAAADIEAMARTNFGSPSASTGSRLTFQKWIQDGGGQEPVEAASGHIFLIVESPDTAAQSEQLFYRSRQVWLEIGDDRIPVHAVTTAGANSGPPAHTEDGQRIYRRTVSASYYSPAPDRPFAIVSEVPASAGGGTLEIAGRRHGISW
jgi:hypothetical protein